MNNIELYDIITESLQKDIEDGSITCEYANILNDIAYDMYVECVELNEEIHTVLEKYIDAHSLSATTESSVDETTEKFFESVDTMIANIEAAYESGEITDEEASTLVESVNAKIDVFTEGTYGKGAGAEKNVKNELAKLKQAITKIMNAQLAFNSKNVQKGEKYAWASDRELIEGDFITPTESEAVDKITDNLDSMIPISGNRNLRISTMVKTIMDDIKSQVTSIRRYSEVKVKKAIMTKNIETTMKAHQKEYEAALSKDAAESKAEGIDPKEHFGLIRDNMTRDKGKARYGEGYQTPQSPEKTDADKKKAKERELRQKKTELLKDKAFKVKMGKWSASDEASFRDKMRRLKDDGHMIQVML